MKKIGLILIIILMIGLLGTGGYILLKKDDKDNKGGSDNVPISNSVETPNDWTPYKDPLTDFGISYPNDWIANSQDMDKANIGPGKLSIDSFVSLSKNGYFVEVCTKKYSGSIGSAYVYRLEDQEKWFKKITIDNKKLFLDNYKTNAGQVMDKPVTFLDVYDLKDANPEVFTDNIVNGNYVYYVSIYMPLYLDKNDRMDYSQYDESIINEAIKIIETIQWGN